jgi:CRP/FNR family transcriptional regulator
MTPVSCKNCSLAHLCLPFSLDQQQQQDLDINIKRAKPVKRRGILFEAGHSFKSLYVVRTGAFKTYINQDGEQQIINFYLPGEIIGFDGMAKQTHTSTAVALTDSFICELSNPDLMTLTEKCPPAQQKIMGLMGQELIQTYQAHYHGEAEHKLMRFFEQLSERFARRRLSSCQFELPMAKQDIANYLGMANETVSRLISKLQDKGLITLDKRMLTIL